MIVLVKENCSILLQIALLKRGFSCMMPLLFSDYLILSCELRIDPHLASKAAPVTSIKVSRSFIQCQREYGNLLKSHQSRKSTLLSETF